MRMTTRTIYVFLLFAVLLASTSCRYPRCPMDNCHIRMKHRHPSAMGKGGDAPLVYDQNAGPEANLGKVYRGTPWWQISREYMVKPQELKIWDATDSVPRKIMVNSGVKNYRRLRTRDPKIAQGYKPGYKYKHKDTAPWGERMAKYKKKRIADEEKTARRESRKGGKEDGDANEDPAGKEMDRQLNEAENGTLSDTAAPETKKGGSKKDRKSKKNRKSESGGRQETTEEDPAGDKGQIAAPAEKSDEKPKKEKKSKRKKEEKPAETEEEKDGF